MQPGQRSGRLARLEKPAREDARKGDHGADRRARRIGPSSWAMPDRSAEPVVVESQLASAAKSQRSLDLEVASELSDDVAPMAEQHRQQRIGRKGTSKKPRRR
jgi:hypothetical protein